MTTELVRSTEAIARSNHRLNIRARARLSPAVHPEPVVAILIKNLKIQSKGILNPKVARQLMNEAAEKLEELSQLPLL